MPGSLHASLCTRCGDSLLTHMVVQLQEASCSPVTNPAAGLLLQHALGPATPVHIASMARAQV